MTEARERARDRQTLAGNAPSDTRPTRDVVADHTRPLTGLAYRQRLLARLCGPCTDCGRSSKHLVDAGTLGPVCPRCRRNYRRCAACGMWTLRECLHRTADGPVCGNCLAMKYVHCRRC